MQEINREKVIEDSVSSFKEIASRALEDLMDELVAKRLPYLEDDRGYNVEYRANDIVRKLIEGDYSLDEKGFLRVKQEGFFMVIKVSSCQWDNLRKELIKLMPECPKDKEIENLKMQLAAWEQR